jgi:uncharacterized protein YbcV (DUF1398 family)
MLTRKIRWRGSFDFGRATIAGVWQLWGSAQSNDRSSEQRMSKAIESLQGAQQQAIARRPKVGGFPYLAEVLRRAGVSRNVWVLPACQSRYRTDHGPVVTLGSPLSTGTADVPPFNRNALVAGLRTDPARYSTFSSCLPRRGELALSTMT